MTALDAAAESQPPKRERKKREQPKIDPAAVLAATAQPEYDVGDMVLYRPHDAARQSLRSNRGLDTEAFPALITFVHPDRRCALVVFRPFGLQQIPVIACAYSAEPKPDTFCLRPAK